ncbi:MAG: PEPxxWA-CTERM sorting domain-containing protein [Phenylobacterium sp.]|uniref:PEPxxWA-CTERM sorting domain-containing protein n=1 Tax=Phenylobacterium sp. TaxID=1871053 RepID=UPI001A5BAA17|nr:PEPxxWA-CTERM sorting domain-containing protein [Phenylobacterium sp.]MBL8555806.1 PEPxxWA-CTERM sorting domain-containing protein [Phenylobacterium sp.]
MYKLNTQFLAGLAAVALAGLALPGTASAERVYGSSGILTNRPCPPDAETCVGLRNFGQFAGGVGVGFSTSAEIIGGASAAAAVSFGDGYLPTIKAASAAGIETRTGASAVAFRTFTYDGDAAIDLALQGTLHYITSGDYEESEAPGEGQLYAQLAILPVSAIAGYDAATSTIELIGNDAVNFADCSTGAMAFASARALGTSGEHTVNLGFTRGCDGEALTFSKGDSFVLVATLQAISNRGGFINAMNTFSVQYDEENTVYTGTTDRVGLAALQQTVNGAVPEPGTWALMIMGFGGAGAMLRRRRAAAA